MLICHVSLRQFEACLLINLSMLDICWNFEGAFLGTVEASKIGSAPEEGEKDNRPLIFTTFLAAPFIATTGLYTERKFSGGDEAGNNIDDVGQAIDAFAHHVLVDSVGSMVLTDLQGLFFCSYSKLMHH